MKRGFYLKIALNNLKRNYRFYVPHVLTGSGMMGCFYIVLTLARDERLSRVKGGGTLPTLMAIGAAVMALLSVILMLYAGSFLMRRRKKEFGLYSVLGMEKRHILRVMLSETLISGGFSIILGLILGVIFYKLCALLICRLINTEAVMGFYYINMETLVWPALFFAAIYLLSFLTDCFILERLKPAEMITQSRAGEKEPKIKWIMLIAGFVTLGAGYYIALSVDKPLKALELFFIAVILVIAGTYFLFAAGSVFVLKTLKRRERFYYDRRHMTTVSGLLYRLKQNAVGLASIAILATGVMIMLSTTVSLYAGIGGKIKEDYPDDVYFSARYHTDEGDEAFPEDYVMDALKTSADESGARIKDIQKTRYLETVFLWDDGTLDSDTRRDTNGLTLYSISFASQDVYKDLCGSDLNLKSGEAAIVPLASTKSKLPSGDVLRLGELSYKLIRLDGSVNMHNNYSDSLDCLAVFVSDDEALNTVAAEQKRLYGEYHSSITERYAINFENTAEARKANERLRDALSDKLGEYVSENGLSDGYGMYWDGTWAAEDRYYELYGTFLFLGIILAVVCMFSTVLIIYHKQISEGYEDAERYRIMEKIGMSASEVKGTVRRQTLTVFFLPLLCAGLHLLVAFGILEKMMALFGLYSTMQFMWCAIITFVAFSVLYVVIYLLTARTYYRIVH